MFRYFGGLAMGDFGMFRYFRYYGYFGFAVGDRSIQPYFLGKVILQWMSCRRMRTCGTNAGLVGARLGGCSRIRLSSGRGPWESPSPLGEGRGEEGSLVKPLRFGDATSRANPHPNPLPEGEGDLPQALCG